MAIEIFNKIKFHIAARGRHGTHSPFVYGFVEHVLRGWGNDNALDRLPGNTHALSLVYLLRTIAYLQVSHIVPMGAAMPELLACIRRAYPELKYRPATAVSEPSTLVVVDSKTWTEAIANSLKRMTGSELFVFFLNHRKTSQAFSVWQSAAAWDAYLISLDFWDGALLGQSGRFLQKQHFLLR